MKSRLIRLLIYVIVVGATLLAVLEIGLRLYVKQPVLAFGDFRGANLMALEAGAKYDETLGWVQPAHITADGFNTMEYGIRKNSSRDGSISQGAILAVGDSYTAGSEVRDEESWPAQLERLARIRVYECILVLTTLKMFCAARETSAMTSWTSASTFQKSHSNPLRS